ncbi:hypothetical protein [Pandoraea soli]
MILRHNAETHFDILDAMDIDKTITHGNGTVTTGTLEGEPVLKVLRGDGQALTIYL